MNLQLISVPAAALLTTSLAFAQSSLENPQPDSFQSGIGVISGWTCGVGRVEIAVNGSRLTAGSGTLRSDTAGVCGRVDTGFGLLVNFNSLGTGKHTAQLFVNGIPQGTPTTFNVVAPAGEFLRGANASVQVANFPSIGNTTTLVWQESQQNFAVQSTSSSSTGAGSLAGTYSCTGTGEFDYAQGNMVIDSSGAAVVNMVSPISGTYRGTGQVSQQGVLNASGVVQGSFTVAYTGTFIRSTPPGNVTGSGTWQSSAGYNGTWTCR